ncbi:MAG: transcription elongation factor GreAB [Myxococcales bacterium]|nr:transcription elongation factor GreAB [Myxococcales bacterium]
MKDELVRQLEAEVAALAEALAAAREGATHEEARPENDKDTRALEQSYLARGQARRLEELRTGLAEVLRMTARPFSDGPIALGALVVCDEEGAERHVLLAPHGGGAALAGGAVRVVTPGSPLGRALLGKRAGDEGELVLGGLRRTLGVVRVS